MSIKAVIFDNDGTIVNSEEISIRFWIAAGQKLGVNITKENIVCLRGCSISSAEPIFESVYGKVPGWKICKKTRDEMFFDYAYKNGIPLLPGARDALEATREYGYKCVLATSAYPSYCIHFLMGHHLFNLFDTKVFGTMVKLGKPDPAIYNLTVEKLGLKPEECLVIEDAPNGINSAYNAHCKVCAVPGVELDEETAKRCDYILKDLTELRPILESLKGE